MDDRHNPTSIALQILLAVEGMAKEWESDGKTDDAAMVREKAPQFAADLSRIIATDPDTALPMLQDHLSSMLANIRSTP